MISAPLAAIASRVDNDIPVDRARDAQRDRAGEIIDISRTRHAAITCGRGRACRVRVVRRARQEAAATGGRISAFSRFLSA
jgi:hypothetical protein